MEDVLEDGSFGRLDTTGEGEEINFPRRSAASRKNKARWVVDGKDHKGRSISIKSHLRGKGRDRDAREPRCAFCTPPVLPSEEEEAAL